MILPVFIPSSRASSIPSMFPLHTGKGNHDPPVFIPSPRASSIPSMFPLHTGKGNHDPPRIHPIPPEPPASHPCSHYTRGTETMILPVFIPSLRASSIPSMFPLHTGKGNHDPPRIHPIPQSLQHPIHVPTTHGEGKS